MDFSHTYLLLHRYRAFPFRFGRNQYLKESIWRQGPPAEAGGL